MHKIKDMLKIGTIFMLFVMFFMPGVSAFNYRSMHSSNNISLFVNGGFGVHFTVVNDRNETVSAEWEITGNGYFINKTWNKQGSFSAGPKVWTTSPPQIVPFSFMPITANLTVGDQTLSRRGLSLMGFTLFPLP